MAMTEVMMNADILVVVTAVMNVATAITTVAVAAAVTVVTIVAVAAGTVAVEGKALNIIRHHRHRHQQGNQIRARTVLSHQHRHRCPQKRCLLTQLVQVKDLRRLKSFILLIAKRPERSHLMITKEML